MVFYVWRQFILILLKIKNQFQVTGFLLSQLECQLSINEAYRMDAE